MSLSRVDSGPSRRRIPKIRWNLFLIGVIIGQRGYGFTRIFKIGCMSSDEIYTKENVPLFEAVYGPGLISLGGIAAVDQMFQGFALRDKHLLDIGFGIGGMAHYLAEKGAFVTGVEVHAWMTEYAISKAPEKLKNRLRFLTYAPDGTIPLHASSIDLVYSKGVLTNVSDKKSLFTEIARVLKPGGQICFVDWLVPENDGPSSHRLRLGDMSYKETRSTYETLLHSCGIHSLEFLDWTASYLGYARDLGKKLSSQDHRDAYQKIIDSSLRNEILKANEDLIASMESGSQISMRIVGTKESS